MDYKRLTEIFSEENDNGERDWEGDNALRGLKILEKYAPGKDVITGADHDIIFSISGEKALEKGLTEEEALTLRKLNWSFSEDYGNFSCFV